VPAISHLEQCNLIGKEKRTATVTVIPIAVVAAVERSVARRRKRLQRLPRAERRKEAPSSSGGGAFLMELRQWQIPLDRFAAHRKHAATARRALHFRFILVFSLFLIDSNST
jgi:hypothetical protein